MSSVYKTALRASVSYYLFLGLAMSGLSGCLVGTQTSGASETTLTISASDAAVGLGGEATVTASGGASPYSYFINSGVGTVDATSGDFVGSSYSNSDVSVGVVDGDGTKAYVTIHVSSAYTSSSSTSVALAASATTLTAGGTLTLSASGGTSPYTYSIVSGGGTLATQTYTAGTANETVTFQVVDSSGLSDQLSVQVISMQTLAATGKVWVDSYVGVTFDNHEAGLDNENPIPQLVLFGIGADMTPAQLAANGSTCIVGGSAEILSPCAIRIPLENMASDASVGLAYKGTVQIVGRNKTVGFDFCVRPSEPNRAYISWTGTNQLAYKEQAYSSANLTLLQGRTVHAGFNYVDTSSGAGYATVTVTNAKYTTGTTCGTGFTSSQYVETSN